MGIIRNNHGLKGYTRQIHSWFSWHRKLLFPVYISIFLSIYDIFIVESDSHVPPTPLVRPLVRFSPL